MTTVLAYAEQPKLTYGYIEKVSIMPQGIQLPAKLDTGAKSASLYAINIKKVKQKGKTYLQFTVPTEQGNVSFKEPLVGHVKIKMRSGEKHSGLRSGVFKRPVVKMTIKLGERVETIRVNLADRTNFDYPLLLGRDAIVKFSGVIDPSRTYSIK